ncbi:hypothetical protein NDU88_001679, partial [Pleurodeles waltl]
SRALAHLGAQSRAAVEPHALRSCFSRGQRSPSFFSGYLGPPRADFHHSGVVSLLVTSPCHKVHSPQASWPRRVPDHREPVPLTPCASLSSGFPLFLLGSVLSLR